MLWMNEAVKMAGYDHEKFGNQLLTEMKDLHYLNIDDFIEKQDDLKLKYLSYNVLRKFSKAIHYVNGDPKFGYEQLFDNAYMLGDFDCVKLSNKDIDYKKFVVEKVIPYLLVFFNEDECFIDEDLMFRALDSVEGDHRKLISQSLEFMDENGYKEPMKRLILAKYTEDSVLIEKYQNIVDNVPYRDNIYNELIENGIDVCNVLQSGDTRRFYPKDGFLYMANMDGQRIVLKEILKTQTDCASVGGFTEEARILECLEHDNIVKYLGSLSVAGHDFLMLDYVDQKPKLDGVNNVLDELKQICNAYDHMKEKGILYLDFKAKNIMYDGSKYIICDFGWSQFKKEKNYTAFSTPWHIVPETALTYYADEKSDIFSLGIYIHERLTNRHPFAKVHVPGKYQLPCLLNYAATNVFNEWDCGDGVYQDGKIKELVGGMLEKDSKNRPDFDELKGFLI
ncbi:protein kinase [Nanoarchaeota archaeon]